MENIVTEKLVSAHQKCQHYIYIERNAHPTELWRRYIYYHIHFFGFSESQQAHWRKGRVRGMTIANVRRKKNFNPFFPTIICIRSRSVCTTQSVLFEYVMDDCMCFCACTYVQYIQCGITYEYIYYVYRAYKCWIHNIFAFYVKRIHNTYVTERLVGPS